MRVVRAALDNTDEPAWSHWHLENAVINAEDCEALFRQIIHCLAIGGKCLIVFKKQSEQNVDGHVDLLFRANCD